MKTFKEFKQKFDSKEIRGAGLIEAYFSLKFPDDINDLFMHVTSGIAFAKFNNPKLDDLNYEQINEVFEIYFAWNEKMQTYDI